MATPYSRHSPRSHSHQHKHHKCNRSERSASRLLPLNASPLSKRDYERFEPLFALYLDVQKGLVFEKLGEREVRGRWRGFVGRWNRGELAEGWYDPATLQKAIKSAAETNAPSRTPARRRASPDYGSQPENDKATTESSNDDDDNDNDDIGPALPNADSKPHKHHRSGPAIPSLQDLELRRGTTSSSHPANVHKPPLTPSPELLASDAQTAHQSLQHDRHQTRHQALSQLNELAPRADPGTRERQLEKKREKAEAHRSFAAGRVDAGDPIEVADADLLGGGEEEGFRKRKGEVERKKNEREVRREEVARARMEEREERVRAYREREERTMRGLVELAKARFG